MLRIQQWMAFILIIFILMIVLIPKESFVNSSIDLYKSDINETEFYKQLYGFNTTEFKEELLWMDRCIKIPMSTHLNEFISNARFPIISKTIQTYTYSDIDQTILDELKNFYLNNRLKTLHGPVYVLIGQSPQLNVVDNSCNTRPLVVQFTTIPDNLRGLSYYQSISPDCLNPPPMRKMTIHIHLLFPTYNTSGKFVYRSWENIKCHLKDLLKQRSKEYPCFLTCMKNPNKTCGCINQQTPYESTCLGDTEQTIDPIRYNYWNLYIINSTYVNRIFNANLDSPFFSENIRIKPFDSNLEYCVNNEPIYEMNKEVNDKTIKDLNYYRITHIPSGRCLDDVPRSSTEKLDKCISKDNQYWLTEFVPGKQGFYLKNKLTKRYLKAYYNSKSQNIIVTTIEKYSYVTLQRWMYQDNQLQLLDPIEGTRFNTDSYLYVIDDVLTIANLNQVESNAKLQTKPSLLDGLLIGIGKDNHLYTKTGLLEPWILADKSRSMIKVHVLKNKLIIGVGTDYQLYTKQTLSSPWVLVPSSSDTYDIAETMDEQLLIIGNKTKRMYTKSDVYSSRILVNIENTLKLRCVHGMNDGTLLGVGIDDRIYTKSSLSEPWVLLKNSCCVLDVFELPNGTILGIHKNQRLYMKYNLNTPWTSISNKECCFISIAFLQNKVDIIDALVKTWIFEPIVEESNLSHTDIDSSIDNRALQNYLLSL